MVNNNNERPINELSPKQAAAAQEVRDALAALHNGSGSNDDVKSALKSWDEVKPPHRTSHVL